MKKRRILLVLLAVAGVSANAQNVVSTDSAKKTAEQSVPIQVIPRFGLSQPQAALRESAFLGDGWLGSLELSRRLTKGSVWKYKYELGFGLSATYNSFSADNSLGYVRSLYKGLLGSGNPYYSKNVGNANSLQITVGPRVTVRASKFSISPGVQVGYMSFRREGYSVLYDVAASGGGTGTVVPLFTSQEVRTGGLVLKPELELGYKLSSQTELSLGASQSFGPAIKNRYSLWQPASGNNSYDELVGGKAENGTVRSPYNNLSYQLGMKMSLDPKSLQDGLTGKETRKKKKQNEIKEAMRRKADEKKKEEEKVAIKSPVITYPTNKSTTTILKDELRIEYKGTDRRDVRYEIKLWSVSKNGKRKLVLKDTVPNNWNGVIEHFSDIQTQQTSTYEAQMNVIASDTAKPKSDAPVKVHGQSKPVDMPRPNVPGFSNIVMFNIAGSCFPDLSVSLDSAKCADSNKTKVWGHITINNTSGLTISSVTITDFKANNFAGPPVSVSNLVPGNSLPPVNNTQFSFNVDENMCNKTLFIRVLITYTCALTGETVNVPCADTIQMPCCSCNYCVDSMQIKPGNQAIKDIGNNMAQINQTFSITPTNIQNVTAEIVFVSDSVNNEACRECDKQPNNVYHFSGTNTISWNSGSAINASSINSSQNFPSKVIAWQCNNQGNLDINLNIGLPALADLSCCSMVSTICIRYSFTDKNCKTCDVVVCYTVTRTPKETTDTKDTKFLD
ncbi:MAG TPA: hypothetical protein VEB40_11115 [Flavipsychrobacter sp.]|nr:hypothetical protein [Flavipsychrobacter sp.]